MPEISRFFGIVIRMHWREHPPAHFHVVYGDLEASISIESLEPLEGRLPRRAMSLVLEWAMVHRPELRENWRRAERHEPLAPIAGLDEE